MTNMTNMMNNCKLLKLMKKETLMKHNVCFFPFLVISFVRCFFLSVIYLPHIKSGIYIFDAVARRPSGFSSVATFRVAPQIDSNRLESNVPDVPKNADVQ